MNILGRIGAIKMRGQFNIILPNGDKIIVPNTIVEEGAEAYLARLFQGSAITGFFVGLCNQGPDHTDTLVDITTEPTIGVNGYARQALAQNGTDWPTISTQNEESFIQSKQVDFTAAGGDFDAAHSRLFLCSVVSGAGILYAYSAALTLPTTVLDTQTFSAQYQLFLN